MRTLTTLTLSVLLFNAGSIFAQACMPDTVNYTTPGIYPDSATGIPPAMEQVPYQVVITMIVPADTMVDLGGGPVFVTIDSIVLKKIVNKPTWLEFDCNPPSCGFPGNDASCALFHGTPPSGSAGFDTLDIIINQHGKISSFPVMVPDTLYDFYVVQVLPGTGIDNALQTHLHFGNVPIPHAPGDVIEIVGVKQERVTLSIYGLSGKLITEWSHVARSGTSFTTLPEAEWNDGVYLLSMTAGEERLTRKLVIAR